MTNDTQATEGEAPVETTATDTADTQPSEASSQEVQEAPEATQEEAPAQEQTAETEEKAEDTAQEEKLYAGKYKTVEDMEKAYQELNSKFSQTTSEKAELAKILNEAFSAPEQPQTQTESSDTDYDYQEESNPLNNKVDKLERQSTVQNFIFSHPDANGEAMQKVLSEDPYVNQIGSYEAKLEYAYFKSQNMSHSKAVEEAKKESAQQTQAKIAEKQTAQVESARKAEPTDEKAELHRKATQGTPDERKQARLEMYKKYLAN